MYCIADGDYSLLFAFPVMLTKSLRSHPKNTPKNLSNASFRSGLFLLLRSFVSQSATLDNLLQQRLFAVTRCSLQKDLQILTELGWLERRGKEYCLVKKLPTLPLASPQFSTYDLSLVNNPDLAWIIHEKSKKDRKESLKQCRIKLSRILSVSIVS